MTPQERLASELSSALWNISTLRHGMFTPPEFRRLCEEVLLRRLNHEHQQWRWLEIGEELQDGDLLPDWVDMEIWREIQLPEGACIVQANHHYRRPVQS